MLTTIDTAGRIVVPKPLRSALGLTAGTKVEIRVRDGRLEIEAASPAVRLERRGRRLVAVAMQKMPLLTAEEVRATLEQIRR